MLFSRVWHFFGIKCYMFFSWLAMLLYKVVIKLKLECIESLLLFCVCTIFGVIVDLAFWWKVFNQIWMFNISSMVKLPFPPLLNRMQYLFVVLYHNKPLIFLQQNPPPSIQFVTTKTLLRNALLANIWEHINHKIMWLSAK